MENPSTDLVQLFVFFIVVLCQAFSNEAKLPAYRVCKPGPPLPYPADKSKLKNCLVVGDSVSIGCLIFLFMRPITEIERLGTIQYLTMIWYTPYVSQMLSGICQVQHAPWDTRDGGALDTKYALECMSLFLSTAQGKATHYDAIIFNSGLHDVQYCPGKFAEEYVPYKEYVSNIKIITERLNLTGAKVGFVSSTPVPYDTRKNDLVKRYNKGVEELLSQTDVEFFDLYKKVVDVCGEPPYNSCFIAQKQPNVHYNANGNTYLGVFVAKLFMSLLKEGRKDIVHSGKSHTRHHKESNAPWKICHKNEFVDKRNKLNINDLKQQLMKSTCGVNYSAQDGSLTSYMLSKTTACPPTMTCSRSVFSSTGLGCCVIPNATVCADGLNCCPHGMKCANDCGDPSLLCSCVAETSNKNNKKHKNYLKSKKQNSEAKRS